MAIPAEELSLKLRMFSKRGWTLKPYRMWGLDKPCPPRLVVNTYKGCEFGHLYCYIGGCARPQDGFRRHLEEKIAHAQKLGLEDILVILSSSTDPFQPIERKHKDSLFTMEKLLGAGFPVLVMTRYPQMLLEEEYLLVTKNPRLYVDISIPSMHENDPQSIFYSPIAPPLSKTFSTLNTLSHLGKYVRIKIEPIIPCVNGVQGQTSEEIDEIVRLAKWNGAKKIISKTMRLNKDIPAPLYNPLLGYYQQNGVEELGTRALRGDIRKGLLSPVYTACQKHRLPFCACVDADIFNGKTAGCALGDL